MATCYPLPNARFFDRQGTIDFWHKNVPQPEGLDYEKVEESVWDPHSAGSIPLWEVTPCVGEQPSPRESPSFINSEIDKLYEELESHIRKRRPSVEDEQLEGKITALFQSIRMLQKKSGDLLEKAVELHLAGAGAQEWAILTDAEALLEDYENSSSSDTPA